MCGIVGYVGNQERCVEVLMEALRRLEYRGSDSVGLTVQYPRPHRAGVPVLELVECWAQAKPGHDDRAVPWPCSTEELQQRIETTLCAAATAATGDGEQEERS